jgi:hypothetical protein
LNARPPALVLTPSRVANAPTGAGGRSGCACFTWDGAAPELLADGAGADLLALVADADGGDGLPDGEPGPDANAAAGRAIAVAVMTPAMARRRRRTSMGAPLLRWDYPKSTDGAQDQPSGDLRRT